MKIGFIGIGKLGLPIASAIGIKGHEVLGYDVNPNINSSVKPIDVLYTVEKNENGEGSIHEILKTTTLHFADHVKDVIEHGEIIFVAVQTPHDKKYEGTTRIPNERKDFDYTYLIDSIQEISNIVDEIKENKTVVIISTVLPGTLRKYILPCISKYIHLCYNPYFIAMGTAVRDFFYPEFILFGSMDLEENKSQANEKIKKFYATITDARIYETTLENAELIKVAYNTFISTKITFVNVLMEMCDKLPHTNVDEVTNALKLANRRLISPYYLTGGMGDGGGCHPRDNIALSWLSNELNLSVNFFDHIMKGREKQTEYLASIIEQYFMKTNLPVCILGSAFKADTNLTVGSPSILLKNILLEKNIECDIVDPIVEPIEKFVLKESKIYFIGTKHSLFENLSFPEGSVVIDPHRYIKNNQGIELYSVGVFQKNKILQ